MPLDWLLTVLLIDEQFETAAYPSLLRKETGWSVFSVVTFKNKSWPSAMQESGS